MTQLQYLEDIIDLNIQDINSLSRQQKVYWEHVNAALISTRKAPSLPAYLLYEHQFKGKTLRDLSLKLGLTYQSVLRVMKNLGIPRRNSSEAVKLSWTPERIKKQSGWHYSLEVRRKMSESHLGIPLSEYHKKRISEGHLGKHHSLETRRKISLALKRRYN